MWLVTNYRHSPRWWVSTLATGVSVAMAFTVLAIDDTVPASVQITGGVSAPGSVPAYDIVVRPPTVGASLCRCVTSPADLTALSGGITLAQYDAIRNLPGVEVAAPMTMVGYVPFSVNVPIDVPASAIPGAPSPVTLTVRLRSDNGLSTVIWDDVTTANPVQPGGRAQATVSVPVSWTFELPLVAVDPVAEARLLHLDAAVTSGSYLPAGSAYGSGAVPLLMAGSIADGEDADVRFDLGSNASVSTFTLTAAQAYSELVGAARGSSGIVRTYWTASPVSYAQAADGELVPQPVAVTMAAVWSGPYEWAGAPAEAGVLDTAFRSLTQHSALGAGVAVRAVGVFDPARVTSTRVGPNPYQPEPVVGADARSRELLGGRPLNTDGDPGGYPNAAATLVMPLADIGAFTGGYSGGDAAAPIGVIRVRVAGATSGDAASQGRVRLVAQEIVRATGLQVDAVLSQTTSTRVIDLPAGLHGRPPMRVDEVWFDSGTRTIVQAGLDRHSISLSELDLLAGEMVIVPCVWRLLWGRRVELATLRALGWRRRQVGLHLLAEFGLTATVAGVAAVAAAYAVGAALTGRANWQWPLLGIPAVIAVIIAAACWPLLSAAGSVLARRLSPWRLSPRKRTRLRYWVRHGDLDYAIEVVTGLRSAWRRLRQAAMAPRLGRTLLRTPSRTRLGVFVIALACAALSLELAPGWVLGAAAASWAGRPGTWQGTIVDAGAVLIIVTMATFTVADLDGVTTRERVGEVRTLRAIGWSARDVARLTVRNALWLGLAGGLAAGTFDLIAGLTTGEAEPRLVVIAGLAVLVGVAMSLLAVGLSAALRCAR